MSAVDRSMDIEAARAVLDGTGFFVSSAPEEIVISPLGGLTNQVFRVDVPGESYVLRIPGKGTEEYISRANEAVAAKAAATAGVAPDLVLFEQPGGVMLLEHVDDTQTMTPATVPLGTRRADPRRAGVQEAARQWCGVRQPVRAVRHDRRVPEGARRQDRRTAGRLPRCGAGGRGVRAALAAHPLPLVACHCDPLCENFLDTGRRMWIVDWEYSGMNDPLWDLGDLSVEGSFDIVQDEEMMLAYFGREPTSAERGRVVIYKAMCDLLWTLWGLIQLANNNPADDFGAYAATRFARCKALMADKAFAGHVAAVAKG